MRGYPLLLEKGAELCTAINISILHKFENTKHKRFGSVGRYMNKRFFVISTPVFGRVRKLVILAKVSLDTDTLRGWPRLIIIFVLAGSNGFVLFNVTNHIKGINV